MSYASPQPAGWEYACRAGTTTEYYWGDKFDGRCAWNKWNSAGKAHPVGLTKPNAWAFYDMSGNVGEGCEDWQMFGYVSDKERVDPKGDIIVIRGGCWHSSSRNPAEK